MDQEPITTNRLKPSQERFVNGLSDVIEDSKIAELKELILNPKLTAEKIRTLQSELAQRTKNRETVQKPNVKKAWNTLIKFINDIDNELKGEQAHALVYGSMIYDDPRNLDYDMLFVTQEDNPKLSELTNYDWTDELNEKWENIGPEGAITYISVQRIRDYVDSIESGKPMKTSPELTFYNLKAASIIQTGYPIYTSSSDELDKIKQQVQGLMTQSPVLSACTYIALESTLLTRKERANTTVK